VVYMKKISLFALLVLIVFVNNSCSVSDRFTYVAPEYKNLNQSGVQILIMPFISSLLENDQLAEFINRKNASKQMLTSKEIELIDNYIPVLLSENTFAKIVKANKESIKSPLKFEYKSPGNEFDSTQLVYIPDVRGFSYEENIPNYLFFVEDAYFNKSGDEKGVTMGRGSESFFVMVAGIEYLLWDNLKGRVAAFGKLQAKQKLLSLPNKESYLAILETFVVDLLSQSPLAQKKVYF